jgi:hypothetical protein
MSLKRSTDAQKSDKNDSNSDSEDSEVYQPPPLKSTKTENKLSATVKRSAIKEFITLMFCCMIHSLPPEAISIDESEDYILHCNYAVFDEPLSRTEALRQPDAQQWRDAMTEEELWCYKDTWELVDATNDMNILTSKWVFKKKRDPTGMITRYRARLVVRGFGQQPGVDYGSIFAPVVRYTTIRLLLALCAHYGLYKTHLDTPKAFTQADLDTPLYMKAPPGINIPKGKVFKLKRSLYGLKQGSARWWAVLSEFLKSIGFIQCVADPCLFYKVISDNEFAFISVYVDDILLATTSLELKANITKQLYDRFQITDEGEFTWSLGMHITTSPDRYTIQIDMEKYTKDIISRFNFDYLSPSAIPMIPTARFSTKDCPTTDSEYTNMEQYPFRQALGSVLFLMVVFRCDISFATISLSRFASNPSLSMWQALKLIYRYLKGTSDIKLTYSRQSNARNPLLVGFTDSDWAANDFDHARAVTGYILFMSGAAISWLTSFRQPGLSTCEVEYYGMGAIAAETVAHTHLINELAPLQWHINSETDYKPTNDTITIHTDNSSALQVAVNPVFHKRMKHVHNRHHFLRNLVRWCIIRFQHVYSADNPSDMMVKALHKSQLRKHRTTCFGPYTAPAIVLSAAEQLTFKNQSEA